MSEKSAWEAEKEKIQLGLEKLKNPTVDSTVLDAPPHKKGFDKECKICNSDRRILLEKWYVKREKTLDQLANVFGFTKELIQDHCAANKLAKKRANNTSAIVDFVLDKAQKDLAAGIMEITMKDVAWAVTHRDKLLGRIVDKKQITQAPVVHIHTSIPGVGGISNKDVEEKKQLENREPVLIPAIVLEKETVDK